MESTLCWTLLALIVFLNVCYITECKTKIREHTVCYNTNPCSDKYHTLTCEAHKRIAVNTAVYGFKSADKCPTVTGCDNATDTSCCDSNDSGDCLLAFHQGGIDQIVEDCYGQSRCSFPSAKTSGSCGAANVKESSYSKLYYRCIAESTIADFCSVETVRGESTFSVYDPRGSNFNSGTCSCTVDSADPNKKSHIQVYGVYMRLNGTKNNDLCSKLTIYDRDTAYVFGCDNDKVAEEEEPQEQSLLNTTTPVTVRLALSPEHLPRYVWIGFEANDGSNLVLRCHANEGRTGGIFNKLVLDDTGLDPDFVAAILFGVLIIVVVLSITLAGFPWYMRKLALELEAQNKLNLTSNGQSVGPGMRRSSRDPKIYVEMEEALNGDPVGNSIPLETRLPYYSDAYDNTETGKRKKSEAKMVPVPEVPLAKEALQDSRENSLYLGMDSPNDRENYRGAGTFRRNQETTDLGSDIGSMIYSEPYAMMSSSSSNKDDNYACPSVTSTMTMGSKMEDTEERYEATFGEGDKDRLRRPDDRVEGASLTENDDEYLLPATPDVGKARRASGDSLQYECMPISKPVPEGRRKSLSYFVNQAFDTDRPPLPPPVLGREPLVDRKPLVEDDEEEDAPVVPADHFDNSEYFMP